jgi:NTF2 fold immunity protein of polymorphic toxin system component
MREIKTIKILIAAAFLVAASVFFSPRLIVKEVSMTPTERAVARVAERYVAIRFPEFDTVKNPPAVYDKGDSWEVEYALPSGMLGGTPVVVVQKATPNVLRTFHTQ